MALQKHEEQIIKATYNLICYYRPEAEQKKTELLELISALESKTNMIELARFMLVSFAWEKYNQKLISSPSDWGVKNTYLLYYARLTSSSISFASVDAVIFNLKSTILLESAPQAEKLQLEEEGVNLPKIQLEDTELNFSEWDEIDVDEAVMVMEESSKKSWRQYLFRRESQPVPEDLVIVNWSDYIAGGRLTDEVQR